MSKILLTRPAVSNNRWVKLLTQRGYDCVAAPVLRVTATNAPRPPGEFQAILLSSANAVEILMTQPSRCADLLALPCFCVGAATGEAARLAGFYNIVCGDADSAALARLVMTRLSDKTRPLLHIAGDIVDAKAYEQLTPGGFALVSWPVYHAEAIVEWPPALCALIADGAIGVIPVFSPRSARILIALMEKHHLIDACRRITAVGLSQAVADVLQTVPWARLGVAATPDQAGMLACVERELAMSDSRTAVIDTVPPSDGGARAKKRKRGLAVAFFLALAAAGAAAVFAYGPAMMPHTEATRVTQNIDALEDRVRMLESRMDAQSEHIAAANGATESPIAQANLVSVTETVKILQAQIAQMQNDRAATQQQARQAAHKEIVAVFTLTDMRQAARDGRGFAALLATFRGVTQDQPALAQPIAVLATYADSGVATWAQLGVSLLAQEPIISAPDQAAPGWWDRIKKILQSLVSVQPLHHPAFDALEQAIATQDGPAARAAFDTLPQDARQSLAAWQDKMAARIAVDAALNGLAAALLNPASDLSTQGARP